MRACKDCTVELTSTNTRKENGLLCSKCRSRRQCKRDQLPENVEEVRARRRIYTSKRSDAKRAYDNARKPLANARRRERRATDPEYRERANAQSRSNWAKNYERGDWATTHRKWVEKNRDKVYAAHCTRRAAIAGVEISVFDWNARLEEFTHACAYCLRTNLKLTQDHIEDLKSGGPHHIDNVVPACQSCNSKKRHFGILKMAQYV